MSRKDTLLEEINIIRSELNELMKDTSNYNSGKILEKSQILDKLIVAVYDLIQAENSM